MEDKIADPSVAILVNSPMASPSMTQRRGIHLRIHVIPPEGTQTEEEPENGQSKQLTDNDDFWSPPPSSRLSTSSDGNSSHSGNNNKHLLTLPSTSEYSPSFISSATGSYYYHPNRRDSSCSFSSAGGSSSSCGSGPTAMSLSPSNMSLSSSLSFGTNTSTFDGSLSPYCLSPTISRPPSGQGWRVRANTTVNRPRLRVSPSGSDGTDSPNTGSDSTCVEFVSSSPVQFRSSRSWTVSGHCRRFHRSTGAIESDTENGVAWAPSSRSTSPHPLGYYSDSPPPPSNFHGTSVGRSSTVMSSPLLIQSRLVSQDDDSSNLCLPSQTIHRLSIGSLGSDRRFSTSLHHPHGYLLAQHHGHLFGHQSPFSSSHVGMCKTQKRRDSAATVVFPIMATGSSGSSSNLHRLHNKLGHSCPQLSSIAQSSASSNAVLASSSGQNPYRSPVGASAKHRRDISIQRRSSHRMSRRSFHAFTSPVLVGGTPAHPCQCCRPAGQANHLNPCPHHIHQQGATGTGSRRNSLRVQCQDLRRWSVTSLPSSGYVTPGSSVVSSRYSSQERIATAIDNRYERFGSGDSHSGSCGAGDIHRLGAVDSSPSIRTRSRSLSSIAWLNLSSSRLDNAAIGENNAEISLRNNVYKDRFPKAKQQMEEKLELFLSENAMASTESSSAYKPIKLSSSCSDAIGLNVGGSGSGSSLTVPTSGPRRTSFTPPVVATNEESLKLLSDGSARFIHHQIMELAMDCLQKSHGDSLSSAYLCELSQNLEDLIEEVKEKAVPEALDQLSGLVKKLLIIISRPARLLECLEFDPEEFYRMLHEAEGHAKEAQRRGVGLDVPQYIIKQLGLTRSGPFQDIGDFLTQSTDSGNGADVGAKSTSPHASRRRPPPKESDFEIIKLISNGAYGTVYLVRHRETRRRFALKKLSKSNLMLRNEIDKVYAERDILTFTDNPFVVSFYGSFETKKHLCMVMEYVEGGDCATLLKNIGVFPVEMARLYIAETILAVEYLHSYGIVHRDLKPDNLLITALGHIKLTDFGLSKIGLMNRTNLLYEGYFDALMTETTQFRDRQICGTPEYIAPEVILRQGYGKPVDWWALGIILYEFLVGTVPFFGETPEELFSHVISNEIEWPEEPYAPPADAKDLVAGLLQQNQLQRLGTVSGALELKEHPFFGSLDWNSLLRQKAEFIPQLEGEDDTSYFDTRTDRYQHDFDSVEGESEDLVVDPLNGGGHPENSLFASFSSASPRYNLLTEETSKRGSLSLDTVDGAKAESSASASSNLLAIDFSSIPAQRQLDTDTKSEEGHRVNESTVSGVQFSPVILPPSAPFSQETNIPNESKVLGDLAQSGRHASTLPKVVLPTDPNPKINVQPNSSTQSASAAPRLTGPKQLPSISLVAPADGSSQGRQRRYTDALHVVIPSDSPGSGATPSSPTSGSSRERSPGSVNMRRRSSSNVSSMRRISQESTPSINQLKPPIVIRRGAKGFGITIRAIRVYLGDSDYYTIQHLITAVEGGSPAYDAGLHPNDLLTHVNGESVQNLTHTDVVRKLMAGGDAITLRVSPLKSTSIRQGGPPRKHAGMLIKKRTGSKQKLLKHAPDKTGKRRGSILRKKRGSFDANALAARVVGPLNTSAGPNLAQLAALQRSISNTDGPLSIGSTLKVGGDRRNSSRSPRNSISVGCNRSPIPRNNDSGSSVESGSIPEAIDESTYGGSISPRPSSLQGLRKKMETLCLSRRKQPSQLSPLARSPQTSHRESLVPVASGNGKMLSPIINVVPESTLLKPIPAIPVVQKTAVKAKKSDNSIIGNGLEHRALSPGSRSLPHPTSGSDSSGSSSDIPKKIFIR